MICFGNDDPSEYCTDINVIINDKASFDIINEAFYVYVKDQDEKYKSRNIVLFNPKSIININYNPEQEQFFLGNYINNQDNVLLVNDIYARRNKLTCEGKVWKFKNPSNGLYIEKQPEVFKLLEEMSWFQNDFLPKMPQLLEKKIKKYKEDELKYTIQQEFINYLVEKEDELQRKKFFISSERLEYTTAAKRSDSSAALSVSLSDEEEAILVDDNSDETYLSVSKDNKKDSLSYTIVMTQEDDKSILHFKNYHDAESLMNSGFYLSRKANTQHLKMQRQSVQDFVNKPNGLYSRLLMGMLTPISEDQEIEFVNDCFNNVANDNNQPLAVKKALANEDVLLIQGPPGTGKTMVITEIINQLVKRGEKVLVCSQAHAAVENIYVRLDSKKNKILNLDKEEDTEIIRNEINEEEFPNFLKNNADIITDSRDISEIESDVESFIYSEQFNNHYKKKHHYVLQYKEDSGIKDLKNVSVALKEFALNCTSGFTDRLKAQIYASYNVVMGTCIGVRTNKIMRDSRISFDTVIIDEAAKANLAESIAPLMLGSKVILVGDDRQLPPYIDRDEIDEFCKNNDKYDKKDVEEACSTSLFQDFHERENFPSSNFVTLNYQFRMHPDISKYISSLFYANTIRDGVNAGSKTLIMPNLTEAVYFFDTSCCTYHYERNKGQGRYYNECEADMICNHIIKDVEEAQTTNPELSVAIISPYREQVRLLRSRLPRLKVYSIDAIQGSEFDVVIFSFVRSFHKNKDMHVGFIDDMRRLNVSLSRARKKLILVGDLDTLTRESVHRKFDAKNAVQPVDVFRKISQNAVLCQKKDALTRFLEKGIAEGTQFHVEEKGIVSNGKYSTMEIVHNEETFTLPISNELARRIRSSDGNVTFRLSDDNKPNWRIEGDKSVSKKKVLSPKALKISDSGITKGTIVQVYSIRHNEKGASFLFTYEGNVYKSYTTINFARYLQLFENKIRFIGFNSKNNHNPNPMWEYYYKDENDIPIGAVIKITEIIITQTIGIIKFSYNGINRISLVRLSIATQLDKYGHYLRLKTYKNGKPVWELPFIKNNFL